MDFSKFFYTTGYRSCRTDEFQCDNGQCIPLENKCRNTGDEQMGCVDKSHLKYCSTFILFTN